MATLVVCLDGTNQIKLQPHPSNIARVFDTLGGVAVDAGNGSFETEIAGPPGSVGKYLPGVGTQGDPVLRFLGNAFGNGIAEPIIRGYTFLSRNYDAGDEIIITGFSRGATAARALAGLVATQGLLNKTQYDPNDKTTAYLRAIAAWYDYRAPNPELADQERLGLIGGTLGPVPKLNAGDYRAPPVIRAVGVFDTVSSLGLPSLNSNGDAVFDFSICDTVLNNDIQNGFHALAADETRDLFSPTFWAVRDGVVQQVFPGCHSDVGGGFPNRGLSDGALEWMLTQLEEVGLSCDRTKLNPALAPNPLDLAQDDGATFPFVLTPRSARAFPDSATASNSLIGRWNNLTEMLPSLRPSPYKATGTYADGRPLN
ncbi:MAG: phospholipase effector Tle1 domain-containing protein [Caulobacteraceae bacterium]